MDKEEFELFEEWKKLRENFCPDGVVDYQAYLSSKPRIMVVLKEANSTVSIDLREFVRNGGRNQTWSNIARWVYGLQRLDEELCWQELEQLNNNDKRVEILKSLIVFNLKKAPGGHTTEFKEFQKVANEDNRLINKQFSIYFRKEHRPDIIIACGTDTSDLFNGIVELPGQWKQTTRGINYFEFSAGKFFIKYVHPEARVPDCLLTFPLIDAVKEMRKSNGI